jgi:hypothetical protein
MMPYEGRLSFIMTAIRREGNAMSISSGWARRLLIAGTLVVGTLALLLLSPLLLIVPLAIFDVNWTEVSSVGQSYTGIAALLSAGALVGVLLSVRLQIHQNGILRRQLVRDSQFRLMDLAMSDPVYASVASAYDAASHEQYRKAVYRNLLFRHLEFCYLSSDLSDEQLAYTLENEIFKNNETREWWAEIRPYWQAFQTEDHRQFFEIIEAGWANSADPTDS